LSFHIHLLLSIAIGLILFNDFEIRYLICSPTKEKKYFTGTQLILCPQTNNKTYRYYQKTHYFHPEKNDVMRYNDVRGDSKLIKFTRQIRWPINQI